MTLAKDISKCPYCREPIITGAIRCKHCHTDLSDEKSAESIWAKYNRFRTGFLCGILFTLIVFVLGYLHFTAGK